MHGTGLVLLTAGLVLGTAGVAGAKTVSDKKYAKSICGAISGVSDTIDQIQPANTGDPSAAQTQILQSTDALARVIERGESEGGKALTQRRREEGHEALRHVLPGQRRRCHDRA